MHLHDNKDPIDDVFRQTFEQLPDSPAASGWDTPSDQVWAGVQAGIKPGNKGTLWKGTLIFLTTAAITATIVWATLKPASPPTIVPVPPPTTAPTEASGTLPAAPSDVSTEANKAVSSPVVPAKSHERKRPAKASAQETSAQPVLPAASPANGRAAHPGGSLPLPGSENAPRNTTEKKQKTEGAKQH